MWCVGENKARERERKRKKIVSVNYTLKMWKSWQIGEREGCPKKIKMVMRRRRMMMLICEPPFILLSYINSFFCLSPWRWYTVDFINSLHDRQTYWNRNLISEMLYTMWSNRKKGGIGLVIRPADWLAWDNFSVTPFLFYFLCTMNDETRNPVEVIVVYDWFS